MSKQKQEYVFNLEPFKKWYKKEYGIEATKYVIAKILNCTYQTVDNMQENSNKSLAHIKTLSELSGLPESKLIKKL